MSDLSPAEVRLWHQEAAHASWANTPDRTARTAPARRAWEARFEKQVDPDGLMSPAARSKAAEAKRKQFYASMARKSAAARRKRKS